MMINKINYSFVTKAVFFFLTLGFISCGNQSSSDGPIKPGESHKIDVKFDSQNRRGFQNKSVTIISNAQPNIQVLRIKAEIVLPEEAN